MSWKNYFLNSAVLASKESTDRSTKVGCVIVGKDGHVITEACNTFPKGVLDKEDRHVRPAKYFYTEHAERAAIYNAARLGKSLEGATLYVSGGGLPCPDCARAIICSGIIEVVTFKGDFEGKGEQWSETEKFSETMLSESGIIVTRI
jgi:dCMP deaminase